MARTKRIPRGVGHVTTPETTEYQIEKVEQAIEIAGGVRALARVMGCSAPHITNIRRGKGFIGGIMAMKFAKYLGKKECRVELLRPDLF